MPKRQKLFPRRAQDLHLPCSAAAHRGVRLGGARLPLRASSSPSTCSNGMGSSLRRRASASAFKASLVQYSSSVCRWAWAASLWKSRLERRTNSFPPILRDCTVICVILSAIADRHQRRHCNPAASLPATRRLPHLSSCPANKKARRLSVPGFLTFSSVIVGCPPRRVAAGVVPVARDSRVWLTFKTEIALGSVLS